MVDLIDDIQTAIEASGENDWVSPVQLRTARWAAEEAISWLERGDIWAALVAIEHAERTEHRWGQVAAYSRAAAAVRQGTWVYA